MAVKTTFAIVGAEEQKGMEIATKLAGGNYHLLLLSNNIIQLAEIADTIKNNAPDTAIEVIDCMKDGCWEADIIILAVPYTEQKKVIENIREVATQKMVVAFVNYSTDNTFVPGELQQLLPYAKVVEVLSDVDPVELFVAGKEEEAVEAIACILAVAGYLPIIKGSDG